MCQGWVCKDELTSILRVSSPSLPLKSATMQPTFYEPNFFFSQKKYQSTENEMERLRVTNDARLAAFFVFSSLLK